MAKEIARNYRQTAIKAFPTFTIAAAAAAADDVGREKGGSLGRKIHAATSLISYPPTFSLPWGTGTYDVFQSLLRGGHKKGDFIMFAPYHHMHWFPK